MDFISIVKAFVISCAMALALSVKASATASLTDSLMKRLNSSPSVVGAPTSAPTYDGAIADVDDDDEAAADVLAIE